jgi:hypothetical protein
VLAGKFRCRDGHSPMLEEAHSLIFSDVVVGRAGLMQNRADHGRLAIIDRAPMKNRNRLRCSDGGDVEPCINIISRAFAFHRRMVSLITLSPEPNKSMTRAKSIDRGRSY